MDTINDKTFNATMAARFREAADVLEAQHAESYRVDARTDTAPTASNASWFRHRRSTAGMASTG